MEQQQQLAAAAFTPLKLKAAHAKAPRTTSTSACGSGSSVLGWCVRRTPGSFMPESGHCAPIAQGRTQGQHGASPQRAKL